MNTAQAIRRMREVIRRQHKAFWLRRYMAALREMPEGLFLETETVPHWLGPTQ
jgi:hypothetical protein